MAKQQPKRFRGKVTLCWVCQNCFGGCSWSSEYIPVEGWKAKKTPTSYLVLSCPSFDPGTLLCKRCFRRNDYDCAYSPLQAGTSRLVADCEKFAPDDPEYSHIDLKQLNALDKKAELQETRGGRPKRAVEQWDKARTRRIQTFESISAATREVGGTTTHIARVCDGEWKSAQGYWWRWAYSQ